MDDFFYEIISCSLYHSMLMMDNLHSTDIDNVMDELYSQPFIYEPFAIKLVNCPQMHEKLSIQLIENCLLYGDMVSGDAR